MQLTADAAALVLDSTADFPDGPRRLSSWRMVTLYVRLGDEVSRDHVDLTAEELHRRLREAPELPASALGGRRVRVVDTESASVGRAMPALAVQRRLEGETSDEEVEAVVSVLEREAGLLLSVDTPDYLAQGGRIGRAQAWAGSSAASGPSSPSGRERWCP